MNTHTHVCIHLPVLPLVCVLELKIFTLGFFLQFSGLLCEDDIFHPIKKQYNTVQQPYHVLLTFIWKTFSSYGLSLLSPPFPLFYFIFSAYSVNQEIYYFWT